MSQNNDTYGFRFREWQLFKDARELRIMVSSIIALLPAQERKALIDQGKRAADSIVLNIAEGSNKNSGRDRRNYLNHAHGSLDEIVSIIDCAYDSLYIDIKKHNECLSKASTVAKQISAYRTYLFDK
jgi:four helix bundle protein